MASPAERATLDRHMPVEITRGGQCPPRIRIERDPAFWVDVASADEVNAALLGLPPEAIGGFAVDPRVTPIAAEHGGFMFARMDGFGFAWEMHAIFKRQGWGFKAVAAGMLAVGFMFDQGADLLMVYEVKGLPASRPPSQSGFVPVGEMRPTAVGDLRLWLLTKSAWLAAPMGVTKCRQ